MRWALALLLVAGTATARVVRVPAIVSECSTEPTWDDIRACVDQQGRSTIAQSLPHARLLRVAHEGDKHTDLALFVETKGWRLAGLDEDAGELLDFQRITLGTREAYRIDLGSSEHDEDRIIQRHEQRYCTGAGYRCSSVMIACDMLVGGKAIATFRGTVTWQDDHLHVAGDRTRAGDECEQPADVPVYFDQ